MVVWFVQLVRRNYQSGIKIRYGPEVYKVGDLVKLDHSENIIRINLLLKIYDPR